MKQHNNLYFTQREKNGILLLFTILGLIFLVFFIVNNTKSPEKFQFEESMFQDRDTTLDENKSKGKKSYANSGQYAKNVVKSFRFDPNAIGFDSLLLLGIDKRTAGNLLKYRSKGGKIKSLEHFYSIYGMEKYEGDFDSLLQIKVKSPEKQLGYSKTYEANTVNASSSKSQEANQQTSSQANYSKFKEISTVTIRKIEINSADSLQWQMLRGIGPKLSKIIVKYRNRLGGFYSTDQLEEVYGLKPETLVDIMPNLTVDPSKIRKIKINSVDYDNLITFPHISKKQAGILIRYRTQHFPLKSIEDVAKIGIFEQKQLDIFPHYFDFSSEQ